MSKKILIIRFSSIGDIVLTSPIVRTVREKFPDAFISFLIKKEYAPLVQDCPYLNEVIIFDKKEGLGELRRKIKEKKFDMVIDLHRNFRSLYIGYFSGIKNKLIYNKRIFKRWLLLNFKINLFPAGMSVIDYYFEALKPLGISNDNKGLEIRINKKDEFQAEEFLKDKNMVANQILIGLAPFAHWNTKCWPLEYYADLMGKLSDKIPAGFIIFGGKGEDKLIGNKFDTFVNKPIIAIGKLNLMAQASLIRKCRYFIGNDTGLMHIADAFNIPLIAFFGPTVPEFGFAPIGKNAAILSRNLKCRPCSLHGTRECKKDNLKCLKSITPDEVSEKVLLNLKGK